MKAFGFLSFGHYAFGGQRVAEAWRAKGDGDIGVNGIRGAHSRISINAGRHVDGQDSRPSRSDAAVEGQGCTGETAGGSEASDGVD